MKTRRQELLSGSNDKVDIKAWFAIGASGIATFMYLIYGLLGLFTACRMDPAIRDITCGLLLGGAATSVATLWNQRLGVASAASPATPSTPPPAIPHPADLPVEDGPAG